MLNVEVKKQIDAKINEILEIGKRHGGFWVIPYALQVLQKTAAQSGICPKCGSANIQLVVKPSGGEGIHGWSCQHCNFWWPLY